MRDRTSQAARAGARWALILATLLGALLFLPFYLQGLIAPLAQGSPGMTVSVPALFVLPLVFWNFLLSHYIFSQMAAYLTLSLLALGLAAWGLLGRGGGRGLRVAAGVAAVAAIAFPWVFSYTPALREAPGYELRLLTRPGRLEGVVRTAQALGERRSVEYTLLGWEGGALYYREWDVAQGRTRVWRYDPAQSGVPSRVRGAPRQVDLYREALARAEVRQIIGAPTSPPLLAGEGLLSPDGAWLALVSEHVYGPQDVHLLRLVGD